MLNKKDSSENMAPPAGGVTPEAATSMVDNVDDYEYLYVTEALSAYPNCYTTEWEDMFESARAPICDDMSNYFFNPIMPQLPLHVLTPHVRQNTSFGDNVDSSEFVFDESNDNHVMGNIDSSKLVVDESNNNQVIVNAVETSNGTVPATDLSVNEKKLGRAKKMRGVAEESDVDASSSPSMSQEVNQAPQLPKSI
ncbi:unnamed protein product [Vicia faba]|uniref:Uncharacterized protein n=1 Tax=Vicia faba TaxID=3906 RepID=A0AAV1AID8_VICFA|nr:unnamed protein product [Vicia faba]